MSIHLTKLPQRQAARLLLLLATCCATLITACGDDGVYSDDGVPPVTITPVGANAVSYWNEVATATINQPAAAGGTPEEARPNYAVDLATVHVAIYDAVMAIDKGYEPFAVTPAADASGAAPDAATAAAAYGVLRALYPSRSATYQGAYDTTVAAIAAGAAKDKGLALGAEVASRIVALRANDGRSVALAPFVPGTLPGQFRGVNPVNREYPFIRPFVLTGASQFRAPGPPALTSTAYATDVNETKALGASASATRTAAQLDAARFHTEPPPVFWTRNLRVFATTNASLAAQARLAAMLWVTHADAAIACFESKYVFLAWRPTSAITLDGDSNAATTADPTWAPVVATPNHPEYPAAHGCIAAATAEVLNRYFGTSNVGFDMTSTVTGNSHHFTTTAAFVDEVSTARVAGGMHFRTALVDGEAQGRAVAGWVVGHAFRKR